MAMRMPVFWVGQNWKVSLNLGFAYHVEYVKYFELQIWNIARSESYRILKLKINMDFHVKILIFPSWYWFPIIIIELI